MSTVINPNNNLLYIAGDTFIEDGLIVRLNTRMIGDLEVKDITANDIDAKNITSSTITNTGQITTGSLTVNSTTILNGSTEINGTLTVNGVETQTIGEPSALIEFYYGDYMELNELVVDKANIANLVVDNFEANSILTKDLEVTALSTLKDIEASGYAEIDSYLTV